MSLADLLKTHTAEMHRFAETRPLQKSLASGRADASTLCVYLAQLGCLHEALERASATPELADFQSLTCDHSRHVQADLQALGGAGEVLEETRAQADRLLASSQSDPWFALGALYVLEGSMNGNRFIVRALAQALGRAPGVPGLSYWDPYGPAQRDRWLAFRAALDALQLDDTQRQCVVAGAEFMFEAVARISDAAHDALLAAG